MFSGRIRNGGHHWIHPEAAQGLVSRIEEKGVGPSFPPNRFEVLRGVDLQGLFTWGCPTRDYDDLFLLAKMAYVSPFALAAG